MAPRKPNKKKVNALLAELGIELKPEDYAPGKAPKDEFKNTMPGRKYSKEQEMIHAESVLLSLHKMPKDWYLRNCKNCKEAFYTNYYYVGYCGDQCRAFALKKQGIVWTNHFDESAKWAGRTPPMIIPPEALAVMEFLVQQAKQGIPHLEQTQSQHSEPIVSDVVQSHEHTEYHFLNESVQVDPHGNTHVLPEALKDLPAEDDFLELLSALDV